MSKNIITIEPSVMKDIIVESLSRIDGIKGIDTKSGYSGITKIFTESKSGTKLVEIEMGENECVINVSLVLYYGYNIKTVTDKAIEVINREIQTITDYEVREINLKVTKLVNKDVEKQEEVILEEVKEEVVSDDEQN